MCESSATRQDYEMRFVQMVVLGVTEKGFKYVFRLWMKDIDAIKPEYQAEIYKWSKFFNAGGDLPKQCDSLPQKDELEKAAEALAWMERRITEFKNLLGTVNPYESPHKDFLKLSKLTREHRKYCLDILKNY